MQYQLTLFNYCKLNEYDFFFLSIQCFIKLKKFCFGSKYHEIKLIRIKRKLIELNECSKMKENKQQNWKHGLRCCDQVISVNETKGGPSIDPCGMSQIIHTI